MQFKCLLVYLSIFLHDELLYLAGDGGGEGLHDLDVARDLEVCQLKPGNLIRWIGKSNIDRYESVSQWNWLNQSVSQQVRVNRSEMIEVMSMAT